PEDSDGLPIGNRRYSRLETGWKPALRRTGRTLSMPLRAGTRAFGQHERAQGREVLHVLVQILRFGRFDAAGRIAEARVIYNVAKTLAANLSLTDVSMAIHS